eukprot:TRINITY_DN51340_c0_g1_i1.p1 TRINITY_DN51340_c0_g1~~TRINITY_DN51340_c0_g1_i1.p1  ORF type:complete len:286 (+),score=39.33 TRINITY_DN51340_c0_g1_i1:65-859(+)
MCRMFREFGYDVIYDFNVDRNRMLRRCAELVSRLQGTEDAVVPIYFAGHGVEVAGMQYLVPVDASDYDPQRMVPFSEFLRLPRAAHLPNGDLSAGCETVRSALYACFLDICRLPIPDQKAPLFAQSCSNYPDRCKTRRQAQASRTFILKGCQAGAAAMEIPGGGGYFTKALLEVPRDASLQDLADHVMKQVAEETKSKQQPCLESECPNLKEVKLSRHESCASTFSGTSSSSSLLQQADAPSRRRLREFFRLPRFLSRASTASS